MRIAELQALVGTAADGIWGRQSKAALLAAFVNLRAPALIEADFARAAGAIGCSVRQIKAVHAVEAAGNGFDREGRPKILYERHKFHRFTGGRFSPSSFSRSQSGGYTVDADRNGVNDNWDKLSAAIATGQVDAAFMACSWGAFQVLGEWWDELGYDSPFALAHSCTRGEGDQLALAVRYIVHFGLQDEVRRLTSNPESCRAFAAAYNGPAYARGGYHLKLARAMATLP